MPNRHGDDNQYRYGFNGMERDDQIKGDGNSYTAEFWEYDCRLGRRWNLDPVTKVELASYACLSNNPIIRVDPKGDDDYYNEFGKWIYTDNHTTNNIKIMKQATYDNVVKNHFGQMLDKSKSYKELDQALDQGSKLVTIDKKEAKKLKQMWDDSKPNSKFGMLKKEHAAMLVLDVQNAKLLVQTIPADETNTRDASSVPVPERVGGVNYISGSRTLIVLGILHTHPNTKSEGYATDVNKQAPDIAGANRRMYLVYTIDHDGVDRIDPNSVNKDTIFTKEEIFNGTKSILRDALEISGKKKR